MENEAAMQNDDAQTTEDQAQATPHRVLSDVERVALLEALLLANGDPLSIQRIQDVVGLSRSEVLESADRLQAALADNARGIELVVVAEIDKIRGVDVAPTLKTLLERKLVKIIGYQASVGQPALYGTTEDFLQVFGLSALSELPALQDLKALVKEPGEAQAASADDGQADEDQDEAQPEVPYQDQPEGSQVSQ